MARGLNYRWNNDSALVTETPILVRAGDYCLVGWNLIGGYATNTYLKLYNSATAAGVTVGTTVPVETLFIPGNGTAFLSNEGDFQIQFNLGIVVAVTTGLLYTNTGAPSTGSYISLQYSDNS